MAQNAHRNVTFRTTSPDLENNDASSRNEHKKLKREWDTPTRCRVQNLFEAGWTRNKIEDDTGVPKRSQRNIQHQGPRRKGAQRPGARRKLSDRCLNAIIRHVSKSFENRQSTWEELAAIYGNGCSTTTVRNSMKGRGYRKC